MLDFPVRSALYLWYVVYFLHEQFTYMINYVDSIA